MQRIFLSSSLFVSRDGHTRIRYLADDSGWQGIFMAFQDLPKPTGADEGLDFDAARYPYKPLREKATALFPNGHVATVARHYCRRGFNLRARQDHCFGGPFLFQIHRYARFPTLSWGDCAF